MMNGQAGASGLWQQMGTAGHELLAFARDEATGLSACIAIHSTHLGPALGGARLRAYASEAEAVADALRLGRAMTYKAACAGLKLGGGKAVINADPARKTPGMMRAFGRFVDRLGGQYVTAEDVGTTVADMEVVAGETRWVTGIQDDPSPHTAVGCLKGIRAALETVRGTPELTGVRVAVQGLGKVGMALAGLLRREGARLVVSDVDPGRVDQAVRTLGARAVSPGEIPFVEADVFAPCALGGVLTREAAPRLGTSIVAGSANNQLAEPGVVDLLRDRGILYAPDYVINAGGLIWCYVEFIHAGAAELAAFLEGIPTNLRTIFEEARREGITTAQAADRLAESRVAMARDGWRPTSVPGVH